MVLSELQEDELEAPLEAAQGTRCSQPILAVWYRIGRGLVRRRRRICAHSCLPFALCLKISVIHPTLEDRFEHTYRPREVVEVELLEPATIDLSSPLPVRMAFGYRWDPRPWRKYSDAV